MIFDISNLQNAFDVVALSGIYIYSEIKLRKLVKNQQAPDVLALKRLKRFKWLSLLGGALSGCVLVARILGYY